jgi:Lrp/AsnC family transcriptional regulator, leucine-responsive regulatory protein
MVQSTLDAADRKILRTLKADGRIGIAELATAVGLSASPVSRRLARLETAGIIKGYTALIDEAALGFGITVFVSVKLERQVDDAIARFEAAVQRLPEVVDCWLMTGNRDYLLRVVTSGLPEFERFLTTSLTRIDCVASIESSIPLRRVKGDVARTE